MGKTEDRVRITVSNCMKSKWLWLLLLQWTTTCFASQIQEQWHGFPPSWNPRRGLIFLSLVALLLLLLLRLKLIYRRLSLVSTWASPSSPEDGYFSRFFFIIIISLFSFSFSFSLNFCSIVVLLGYGCVEFWYILGSVWQNWCSATCLAEIFFTFWWLFLPVLVVILIWCVNVVLICGRHVKIHEIGLSIFFCGKFTWIHTWGSAVRTSNTMYIN